MKSELTVKWIIRDSGLKGLKCVAGARSLESPIASVNVLDNIDPANWMRKDELVLTTGYLIKDDPKLQISILHDLKKAGCGAFGIKVNRFFDSIPDAMIGEAESLGLPLIEIPYYYRFSEISQVVFDRIFSIGLGRREEALQLQEELFVLPKSGADVNDAAEIIMRRTKAPAIITDSRLGIVAFALPNEILTPEPVIIIEDMDEASSTGAVNIDGARYNLRLFSLGSGTGFVFFGANRELEEAVSSATPAIAMLMGARSDNRTRNYFSYFVDFLEGQTRSDEEIRLMCDMYGFNYGKKRICLTVKISQTLVEKDPSVISETYTAVDEILEEDRRGHFMCRSNNLVSAFLYFDRSIKNILAVMECRKAAEGVRDVLYSRFAASDRGIENPFLIGIGRCHVRLVTIPESFRDSLKAIHLLETFGGEEKISSYFEQMTYHVLSALGNEELKKIYGDTVKILEEYDRNNKTFLVETLNAYFLSKFNQMETAKRLYLHRNTLSARLEKIKNLLNMDLNNPGEVFALYLGLCAMKLLRESQT